MLLMIQLHEVRELAQLLLQDVTNTDKYRICPPTGVLDTSAALQVYYLG